LKLIVQVLPVLLLFFQFYLKKCCTTALAYILSVGAKIQTVIEHGIQIYPNFIYAEHYIFASRYFCALIDGCVQEIDT
jgi:hypothetical protein